MSKHPPIPTTAMPDPRVTAEAVETIKADVANAKTARKAQLAELRKRRRADRKARGEDVDSASVPVSSKPLPPNKNGIIPSTPAGVPAYLDNPPRARTFQKILQDRLARLVPEDKTNRTYGELIGDEVVDRSVGKGGARVDMDTVIFIRDTVDGKPRQAVEMSGPNGAPITSLSADLSALNADELSTLIANLATLNAVNAAATVDIGIDGETKARDGSEQV